MAKFIIDGRLYNTEKSEEVIKYTDSSLSLKRLSNQEDFNNIQYHNFICIEFQDNYEHKDNRFTICKNCYVVRHLNELIFNKRDNDWVDIKMYLKNKSNVAKNIYLVEESSHG